MASKKETWALVAALWVGCVVEDPDAVEDSEDDGGSDEADTDDEFRVREATPVPPGELLGMAQVYTSDGVCSGMLIARDTVLTAAHCFCTDDLIGGNTCDTFAEVAFQDDPAVPGHSPVSRTGIATIHPSYNPSWVDNQHKHDLAVVALDSPAPMHVPPFIVSATGPISSSVKIAGFGLTGDDCDGNEGGALHYDFATIGGYEDYSQIIRFDDPVFCEGDSGGAVLDPSGTVLYGVHSTRTLTVWHGWVSKSIGIPAHYAWVKSTTCAWPFEDACSKGPICRCGVGGADCDSNADCDSGLNCAQDVGASYGLPATADVCVNPGPVEGTCGCGNSGFGNVCQPHYNGCNPGYGPHCSPTRGACGGCSCY